MKKNYYFTLIHKNQFIYSFFSQEHFSITDQPVRYKL